MTPQCTSDGRWLRASAARLFAMLSIATMLALSGCALFKSETPKTEAPANEPAAKAEEEKPSDTVANVRLITAQTPAVRSYRKLAAKHIYDKYPKRIFKGKIPPLVYAVVVSETEIDASGKVTGVYFSRTPSHAPEVSGKVAELIRDASPFPNPGKIGAHTYVDTWLWDKSGNFQLDTLTLGQRAR